MPDLAQFLLARITADELVARTSIASGGGEWWTEAEIMDKFGDHTDGDGEGAADAAHIARFSPERVLAECDAKRRVLDDHFPNRINTNEGGQAELVCVTCSHHSDTAAAGGTWPCTTVRALALPYADHPTYRDH